MSPRTSSVKNGGSQHSLLLALPGELRNHIYDLAFNSQQNSKQTAVDLFQSPGPRPALLLTCRKVYSEALAIYEDAYKHYWSTTFFFVNGQRSGRDYISLDQVNALDSKALSLVKHLRVRGQRVAHHRIFDFKDGIWNCNCSNTTARSREGCPQQHIFIPEIRRKAEDLAMIRRFFIARLMRVGPPECRVTWPWAKLQDGLSEASYEDAKQAMGWQGLTKKELVGMLMWYRS